jgi:hypothetical protein
MRTNSIHNTMTVDFVLEDKTNSVALSVQVN